MPASHLRAADLRRFRLRFLGHNLSPVVDCPSNRLDGRLTFQKGFNRALRLSPLMSSSSRQRPYPIPPLLPQLAESTLKVSQMPVLNHFHVLSSLSDMRRALAALHQRICHVIRRSSLIGGRITLEEAIKGSNEPAKIITVLKTPWLTGLNSKALHGLLG
jgi:hypothetical protein